MLLRLKGYESVNVFMFTEHKFVVFSFEFSSISFLETSIH